MYSYKHKVKYYETDKMGVTHHSNYIRFMEEARSEWLESMGWSYKRCEDCGIVSPVLSMSCKYKKTTTFDDTIDVTVRLIGYNGIRLNVEYNMKKDGETVLIGESEHCFLDKSGVPVRIKKEFPEFDEVLTNEFINDTSLKG